MFFGSMILYSVLDALFGSPGSGWCMKGDQSSDACQALIASPDPSHVPQFHCVPAFWCHENDPDSPQVVSCDLGPSDKFPGQQVHSSLTPEIDRIDAGGAESIKSSEPAGVSESGVSAATRLEQALTDLTQAYATVNDYTATLHKQERVGGKLLPQEKILVKVRKPYSIYMKWIGAARKGQEILYVRGWNGGKVRAHPGSFPDITVNLDPRGKLAMRADRHPATEASIGDVINIMRNNLQRAAKDEKGRPTVTDLGESMRFGVAVRCFQISFPSAGYYGHIVSLCVFVNTKLLSRVQVWDRSKRLLEDYEYQNLRTNVGLHLRDFDPANANYNF